MVYKLIYVNEINRAEPSVLVTAYKMSVHESMLLMTKEIILKNRKFIM